MFERPETLFSKRVTDSDSLVITPPAGILGRDGRPDDAWVLEQEILLNQKYPGRNLLLEYHSLDNKMHVTENKSDTSDGKSTLPLDEWIRFNS